MFRRLVALLTFVSIVPDCAVSAPLQYLTGAGARAQPVVSLTWGTLLISVIVICIIAALLLFGVLGRPVAADPGALLPEKGGLSWLWIGVGLTLLALLFTIVWTMQVLANVQAPAVAPRVTIEVTGRQWWWQARYLSDDTSRQFTTANEIHIPAGEPVRIRLVGGDVIHSFWVPLLAGKMDAIPGLTNETWIEAAHPGVYRGQCTEYCGPQHAHMALEVVADAPGDFAAWWNHQLQAPADQGGAMLFAAHCGSCHAVRGTEAAGALGPDLSHLMRRATLASGILPNNRPVLRHWIADPQAFKPGSLMPAPSLTDAELDRITDWLEGLE
jgi:cytochrome c oxidase subunit 2